jgi:predicted metal-dependent hydrolase
MLKQQRTHKIQDLEFEVVYSNRRTLGISVLPDSSVIVRVPYLTSLKTINRIIQQKAGWIKKHRDICEGNKKNELHGLYVTGESHLFRGKKVALNIAKSVKPYIRFNSSTIDIGLEKTDDYGAVKRLLYKGYKNEASVVFPEIFNRILINHENQQFKPTGLIIRTMKRRWGSCSNKGVITLSTELIKLSDLFIEYIIIHELCHLKHHNHGAGYYKLLSELFPDWKNVRKDLRKYITY